MRTRPIMLAAATLICAASLLLAACTSGSHSSLPVVASAGQTPASGTAPNASVNIVLKLPARTSASAKRLPKYISASTKGARVVVTLNSSTTTSYFDLSTGSPICATASDGSATCTLVAKMPSFGTATIAIFLYDDVTSSGYVASAIPNTAALLSSGTVSATVTEGAATVTVPVILTGVIEGIQAVSAGSLTSAVASQTTFVLEATDADGNVILASDGVVTRNGSAVALTLGVPNSIAGVTMNDITQTPNGSYTSTLTDVKIGDTISIETSVSTPQIVGVPVYAILSGPPAIPVGQLRIPSTYTSLAPNSLPTTITYPITEIAGVPAWATTDGTTYGNGFVYVDSGSSNQLVGSVSVNVSSHTLTSVYTCSFYGTGVTVDHVAQGAYGTQNFILGEHTGIDVLLSTLSSSTCPNGTRDLSALSQGLYTTGTSITDVADDGTDAGAALVVGAGGSGSSYIFTVADGATASGGNLVTSGSLQAIDSLNLFYSKALVLTTAQPGISYRNPTNFLQFTSLGSTTPRASAVDDAGDAYILSTAGILQKCRINTLPGLFTCNTLANLASPTNYAPAANHRAIAVGADGNVWVASASGLLKVNSTSGAVTQYGSASYQEVVASGDGHLYLLSSGGSQYFDFP